MTWTELFVWGIAAMLLAFAYFCLTWISDPQFRKEAGVKLPGDPSDEEEVSFATVEDYDDPKQHPDQWSEKIILPARGRRPEMTIILQHSPWDMGDEEEAVSSNITYFYYTASGEQCFM
jgi:hypothetical protein